MAWRCRLLAARPSQDGCAIVHPTHWLISTQQLTLAGLLLAAALGGQSRLYGGISGITLRTKRRQPRGGRVDGVGGG